MLRLSRLYYLSSTFGVVKGARAPRRALSDFCHRASNLKKRYRGQGQYAFARSEAQRFLDAEVPKANVDAWMESKGNAVALSQLLRFFEVQPDATLSSLLLNKLVRSSEDTSENSSTRLEAIYALTQLRPEENYERAFATVESVLKSGLPASPQSVRWERLDQCAKVLQRCGKRVPTALNNQLAVEVMSLMRVTDSSEFPRLQQSLLRIYGWMIRAERDEAGPILRTLVTQTGDFKSYQFSTLMLSCQRHHQLQPLPVELIHQLTRAGLQYCTTANGSCVANTVGVIARMLASLEVGVNEVSDRDLRQLSNRFSALLEEYRPRVLRLIDHEDSIYWSHPDDITSIAFAYEMGGHQRYRTVFEAFGTYVHREVVKFEPSQLALATGILRRSQLLTPALAEKLSERMEMVLGELRLSELSHVCATFASLPSPPHWLSEAQAVTLRHNYAEATGLTRFNLAVAFPALTEFVSKVDYALLSGRQLVDALPLVLGKPVFEGPLLSALVARLNSPTSNERFSSDDAALLLTLGRPALVHATNAYLYRRCSEPEWDTATLFSLPLVLDMGGPARDPVKALAAAKAASISAEQFVSLAEVLLRCFGDTDSSIVSFVVTGGEDLVEAKPILLGTLVRYLAGVRGLPKVHPSEGWLSSFTECIVSALQHVKLDTLESLLLSLHTIYGGIHRTPALQMLLSEVVEQRYQLLKEATEQVARITVLLAHLQKGMSLSLLSDRTPMVVAVRQQSGSYSKDVRDAVLSMPISVAAPTEAKLGRFILKQIPQSTAMDEEAAYDETDSPDLTLDDPFVFTPAAEQQHPRPPEDAVSPAPEHGPKAPDSEPVTVPELTPASLPAVGAAETEPTTPTTDTNTAAAEQQQYPTEAGRPSYYAKFFSLLRGDEDMPAGRPRRANLSVNGQNVLPEAPAVAEISAWGTPPTFPQPSAAAVATDGAPGWGAPPVQQQQPPVSTTEPYGIPTSAQNAALFSNLFDHPAVLPEQPPAPPTVAPAGGEREMTSPTATAFSSIFASQSNRAEAPRVPPGTTDPTARRPAVRTNMVLFDPAYRSGQPGGAGSRPMMSKKAVMSRMMGSPRPSPSADQASTPPPAPRPTPYLTNKLDFSRPAEEVPSPVAVPAVAPATASSPLAWQEAARRVAGISRHAKTKAKSRNQHSLSEWLKNPEKKLDVPPPPPAHTAVPAEESSTAKGRRGKGGAKKESTAPAPVAPVKGASSGRGKAMEKSKKSANATVAVTAKKAVPVAKAAKGKGGAAKKPPAKVKPAAKNAKKPTAPKPKPAAKKPSPKTTPVKGAKGKKK